MTTIVAPCDPTKAMSLYADMAQTLKERGNEYALMGDFGAAFEYWDRSRFWLAEYEKAKRNLGR